MFQCQECRRLRQSWRKCPGGLLWYEPNDIRFCPNQMMWLYEHDHLLANGQWPPDPQDTGYYDTGKRTPSFKGAYFEGPIGYHVEINWRLDQCNKDGQLARQHYVEGMDELSLAELINVSVYKVQRRLRRVLVYVSGYNRKSRTYYEFIQSYSPKYRR